MQGDMAPAAGAALLGACWGPSLRPAVTLAESCREKAKRQPTGVSMRRRGPSCHCQPWRGAWEGHKRGPGAQDAALGWGDTHDTNGTQDPRSTPGHWTPHPSGAGAHTWPHLGVLLCFRGPMHPKVWGGVQAPQHARPAAPDGGQGGTQHRGCPMHCGVPRTTSGELSPLHWTLGAPTPGTVRSPGDARHRQGAGEGATLRLVPDETPPGGDEHPDHPPPAGWARGCWESPHLRMPGPRVAGRRGSPGVPKSCSPAPGRGTSRTGRGSAPVWGRHRGRGGAAWAAGRSARRYRGGTGGARRHMEGHTAVQGSRSVTPGCPGGAYGTAQRHRGERRDPCC